MLSIRLSRKGKRKQPIYRLIVCEKTKDPWGDYLENLGWYNPRTKELELKADRIKHWLDQGAQPSDTIWNLLNEKGIVEGKKRSVSKISKKRLAKAKGEDGKNEGSEAKPEEGKADEKPAEEAKSEEPKQEAKEEKPVEEVKEEKPAEEKKEEGKKE